MSKGTVFRNDRFSAPYIEVSPIFLFRVGLSSTRFLDAGDVAEADALDRVADQPSGVDRVDLCTTDP